MTTMRSQAFLQLRRNLGSTIEQINMARGNSPTLFSSTRANLIQVLDDILRDIRKTYRKVDFSFHDAVLDVEFSRTTDVDDADFLVSALVSTKILTIGDLTAYCNWKTRRFPPPKGKRYNYINKTEKIGKNKFKVMFEFIVEDIKLQSDLEADLKHTRKDRDKSKKGSDTHKPKTRKIVMERRNAPWSTD